MSICERLKAARKALQLTQRQAAEQSGVSVRSYQGYEDGRSVPGGEALAGLVGTGINANWLLTGQGPMLLSDLPIVGEKIEIPAFLRRSAEPLALVATEPPVAEYGAPVLDPHLLEAVTSALFSWIDEHKDVVRIDPSRYGALITVLYRWAANSGGLRADDLEQIMRAAA